MAKNDIFEPFEFTKIGFHVISEYRKIIKLQQSQALTSHFESFWSMAPLICQYLYIISAVCFTFINCLFPGKSRRHISRKSGQASYRAKRGHRRRAKQKRGMVRVKAFRHRRARAQAH